MRLIFAIHRFTNADIYRFQRRRIDGPGASTMTTTAFNPNPITVSVGGTVTWTNNDSTSHTSTANGGAWSPL